MNRYERCLEGFRCVINQNSAENPSNTPDYVLAAYLVECLEAYDRAVYAREKHSNRITPKQMFRETLKNNPEDLVVLEKIPETL